MEIVCCTIFSYSEGYNFINRQVCCEFREMIPEIHGCVYLDQLIKDGKKPDFTPSFKMVELGVKFNLFSLLEAFPSYTATFVCTEAIKNNNIKVLQWAKERGYKPSEYNYIHIAQHANLETVKYLIDEGYVWSRSAFSYMARCGCLDILEYLVLQGLSLQGDVCAGAAEGGHLGIIKWALSKGCPLTTDACSGAAREGHLQVLQWLREHGCPWDRWTILAAARGGHLEVLQWSIANHCPWDFKKVYLEAGQNHRKHVLKWLRENYKEQYETCWDWS